MNVRYIWKGRTTSARRARWTLAVAAAVSGLTDPATAGRQLGLSIPRLKEHDSAGQAAGWQPDAVGHQILVNSTTRVTGPFSLRVAPNAGTTLALPRPSDDQTNRLALLGQVWGFLKYFHPGVARGAISWDSVLVASAPSAAVATTKQAFDSVLAAMLDAAGEVPPCGRCPAMPPDSAVRAELGWLTDTTAFGPAISRRLIQVRDNRHIGAGRYVSYSLATVFDGDTAFKAPVFPSEWVRYLAVCRFWNVMRYYFPYMDANGEDWNAVLIAFIPRVRQATTALEYDLAIAELTAHIHDTHVIANGAAGTLAGLGHPFFEVREIEGQIVVVNTGTNPSSAAVGPHVGDVITRVDGVPVAERRAALASQVSASNPAAFARTLSFAVVTGARRDSATYVVDRGDGVQRSFTVPLGFTGAPARRTLSQVAMVLPNTNVGYLDMGALTVAQVDSAFVLLGHSAGIVIDLRDYPQETAYLVAEHLLPVSVSFSIVTTSDSTFPGQYKRLFNFEPTWRNPQAYRGRIAILVNEHTQSQGEFAAMILQAVPEHKVIGSQTAGADGDVARVNLPGFIFVSFSACGVYYPDGRPTQRTGIVPDILVRPTLSAVRAGHDEVLERGIRYVQTGG